MMRLAHTGLKGRGQTDLLLSATASGLMDMGLSLAGTIQVNSPGEPGHACDMDLQLLPGGPTLRISEDRGTGARGCRLDSGALEGAAEWLMRNLDGADLLIINKFGRQEAEGRGLVPVIAEALSRDLPVLVGVNALNLEAWHGFSAGMSQALPPETTALASWCRAAVPRLAA